MAKKDSYKDNDKDKYKNARYAAEKATKTDKAKYWNNIEQNLTINNNKIIWKDLKAITSHMSSSRNIDITDNVLPD